MPRPLTQRLGELAAKFVSRATAAQPDYEREVARPDTWERWKQNAVAAAPTYNAAMREVVNQNRWGAAIQAADPRTYGEMVRAKAARRVQGLQLAQNKWQANYAPIAQAIDQVRPTLPPRGPKMSTDNINRFMTMIRAIHEAAMARRGIAAGAGVGIGAGVGAGHYGAFPPPVRYPAVEAGVGQPREQEQPSVGGYGGFGYGY